MLIIFKSISKYFKDKKEYIKAWVSRKIKYLEYYVEEKDFSTLNIEDLAPKDNLEDCTEYHKSLEYGIENKNVHNIALTGPYGSGKSSLLRTFEKNYNKYKYINISLASFIDDSVSLEDLSEEEKLKKINEQEKNIEKGILQQIFYKVDSKRIPYARFRKIKNLTNGSVVKYLLLIISTLGLGVLIFKPNIINSLLSKINELNKSSNKYITIAIYITFISLVMYTIAKGTKLFKAKVNLKSLSIDNAQIDFEINSSESILNKYLDEILYFFEVTQYNVVVIEDLDRFKNIHIFTKLRELNQLINNYEKVKRKVVFIYAIKDDMFKDNERTKFFELIVPVIPVMNSINSGDILLSKIRQDDLGKDISNEFIIGVSVYIEDRRMLNNIYNEYRIFKNILNDISLKSECILALIIYKNLYPRDYSELLYNKGLLYNTFENKKRIVSEKGLVIDKDIDNLKIKLKNINNEHMHNLKELKILFLSYISENKKQITRINGNTIDVFMSDEFDMYTILESTQPIEYYYYENGSGRYRGTFTKNDYDTKLIGDITFTERYENLKAKLDNDEKKILEDIEVLKEKKNKLRSAKLFELIKEYNISSVLDEKVINEKVIVYLLRHNKINETYINYLTYFHNNIVTAEDMNFILAVRNFEIQDFDYKLTKIDNVIGKLNILEFEQKEILNFDLIKYILNNKLKYPEYFEIIFKQLSDESHISINFIDQFMDNLTIEEERILIESISEHWCNLWKFINNNCNYPKEKLNKYVCKIINYNNLETIERLNINNELSKYIESNKELLCLFSSINIEKVKEVIKSLNLKFECLNVGQVNQELIDFIVSGTYFEINEVNIEFILKEISNQHINNIKKKNFTTIRKSGNDVLNNYIDDNILEYVEKVLLLTEENTNEDIDRIVELLTLDESIIDTDTKMKILQKEEFKLNYIEEVSEVLWSELLKLDKVEISWTNLLYYYNYIGKLDLILANCLNSEKTYTLLSKMKIEDNNENSAMIEEILESEKISIATIEYLVKSISWTYSEYDTVNLKKNVAKILIVNKVLILTKVLYDSLRTNFEDLHIKLIECNLEEFIKNIEDFKMDYSEIDRILSLPNCEYKHKKVIISKINDKVTINTLDNEKLINNIYKIIVEESHVIKLENNLYWAIFEKINKPKKVKLLANQSKYLNKEDIDLSLQRIGEQFANISVPASREKIIYSEDILELAVSLESNKYISSKSIVAGKDGEKYVQFNAKRNKDNQ